MFDNSSGGIESLSGVATTRSTANQRKARTSALAHLLWVLLGLLLVCQIIIWSNLSSPELALIEHLAVQLSGFAALGATLALLLRRWGRLAAFVVLAITLAAPTLEHSGQASTLADTSRLRLLSVNLWHDAPEHHATIDALLNSGADIIGLVEVTEGWRRVLQPVIARYPYRVDCFKIEPDCQTMLLSKLPIEKPIAGRVWKSNPIVAGGEVTWHGRRLAILAMHLSRPLARKDESRWYSASAPDPAAYLGESLPYNRQATQAGRLAKYLNAQLPDLIVLGDFNAVPWSRVQRAFRAKTGLRNEAGWVFSWPAWLPWPLRLPLDHILSRGHLVVVDFTAGTPIDSDHLPIAAEIGWRD